MSVALSYRIEEIENAPELAESLSKECFACDIDNPLCVPRATCETCGGTGRQPFAVAEIAKELKESKRTPRTNGKESVLDEDLYFEY